MSTHEETVKVSASGHDRSRVDRPASRDELFSPLARVLFDAATLATVLLLGEFFPPGRVGRSGPPWVVTFALLALALLHVRGAYKHRLRLHILDDLRLVVTTTALAAMAILSLRVLLTDNVGSAGQTAWQWAFATAGFVATHAMLCVFEIRARQRGEVGRPTLIVGAGKVGRLVAARLSRYPEFGLRPVGFLDDAPLAENGNPVHFPVVGGTADLDDAIGQLGVRHVVVTFSMASHETLLDVVKRCEEQGVSVSFVPRLFEKMKEKIHVDSLGSLPLLSVDATDPKSPQFVFKYVLDRILSALLLLIGSPILLGAALAVWVSSGRPILYRQLRVGLDGRPFEMLKFRSMTPDTSGVSSLLDFAENTAPGGAEGADRRTRVGALLRRTSLDELPQLINVFRGEMSLVGPRPERPEFVEIFDEQVHRYSDRHRVKAGITGWAQINGLRGNTPLSDRAEWDNYYIDNWSLWLDLKILLSTATVLVRFPSE